MKTMRDLLAMGMAILPAASLLPFGALAGGGGEAPGLSRKGAGLLDGSIGEATKIAMGYPTAPKFLIWRIGSTALCGS